MDFFGFTITRSSKKEEGVSFAPKITGDAITLDATNSFASNAILDLESAFKTEEDLIIKYRELSLYSEVDSAIQEIVSEAITEDIDGDIIELDLSNIDEELLPQELHESVQECFKRMSATMQIKSNCAELFRKWYTEGRLMFHSIIDPNNMKLGVLEYRYIDPINLKKINEVEKEKSTTTAVDLYRGNKEYYIYVENGASSTQGLKISSDTIVSTNSGLIDGTTKLTLSYLHKALRPANQLRMIEDANLIYFMTRAPERRIFEIEVGQLTASRADSYVKEVMNQNRNKSSYDSVTGEQKESKRFMSMVEDYWIPVRDGKGVKINNLAGGTQLTQQLESINYFKQKLYKSLNIPLSRIDSANAFNLGRATEITRDEVKFSKFISSLRRKFSIIFLEALRVECILSGVLTLTDWEKIEEFININFAKDNHFTELKELEVFEARLDILDKAKSYQGKFFSKEYLALNVLGQTEDEFKEEQEKIRLEKENNPTQDEESEDDNGDFGGSSDFGSGRFGGNTFSGSDSESNLDGADQENPEQGIDTSGIESEPIEEPDETEPEKENQ
jgi:hypothetical protein